MTLKSQDILASERSMRVHVDVDMHKVADKFNQGPLLFDSLQGEESLSSLPTYTVRLLHRSDKLKLDVLLGKSLTVTMDTLTAPRHVAGLITQAELVGPSDDNDRYFSYEFKVNPWLWLTTLNQEFRIYQDLTVPQIVTQVLESYGLDFKFVLLDTYPLRPYCVQYGESDFNFVSRLLEAEGIYYYFQYGADKHTLVLADTFITHDSVEGYEEVPYYGQDKLIQVQNEYLSDYHPIDCLCSDSYSAKGYNFLGPSVTLYVANGWPQRQTHHPEANVYEWPGGYQEYEEGDFYARRRAEELQHKRAYQQFSGTVRGLVTGSVFRIHNDPNPSKVSRYTTNKQVPEYIVLSTQYDLKESPYQSIAAQTPKSAPFAAQDLAVHKIKPQAEQTLLQQEGMTSNQQQRCLMRMTVQDKLEPFRPLRRTPKPRTLGPQTAVVVGPEGHEIWTNEHGQVKVHFQWDRYGQLDEHSSCWIRVSSAWASNNFGVIQVPRIGDEVIVDFLNGDPDYPMITGRVYNGHKMPPWKLPDHATQMGIYSHSTPGGTYDMRNALRFEDKIGEEEIYIHAQKDQNIKIGNNYSKRIDKNKLESVGHNKGIEVSNNHVEVIGGDMQLFVGPTQKGRFTPASASNQKQGLGHVAYGLGHSDSSPQGEGNLQLSVENNKVELVGNNHAQRIQYNKSVDVQNNYYMDVGDELMISAGKRIRLQCGQSVILMNPDGSIQINGKTLTMNLHDIIRLVSEMIKVN